MFARTLCGAVFALMAVTPAQSNKPLIGVACGEGFYVRAPTQKIYWIHGDPAGKTLVHDGEGKLAALAECGSGVVAVFQNATQSQVFSSSDCLNIGAARGNTRMIFETSEPITALNVDAGRLTIRTASGSTHDEAICHQP